MIRFTALIFFLMWPIFPAQAAYRMGGGKPEPVEKKAAPKSNPKTSSLQKKSSFGKKAPASQGKLSQTDISSQRSQMDETAVLKTLAEQFHVAAADLKYLRGLRYGFRDLAYGLIVSRESGVELGRILQEKTKSKDWKNVATQRYINFEDLKKEGEGIVESIRGKVLESSINEQPVLRTTQ